MKEEAISLILGPILGLGRETDKENVEKEKDRLVHNSNCKMCIHNLKN